MNLEAERNRVTLPTGAKDKAGVAPPAPPQLTDLVESSFEPHVVSDLIRRLATSTEPAPNLLALAKILGLGYFVGDVELADDTAFQHDLKRIPVTVVWSIDLGGMGGQVTGLPEGSATSPNAPWTATTIYVRATRAARYAFFVM